MRPDLRRRPFLALALAGLACALLVVAGGRLTERLRLGPDDRAAYANVEREVRDTFQRMAASLEAVAAALSTAAAPVLQSPADERDLRPLFDQAAAATRQELDGDMAATVYGPEGLPLAWAGRPSQLNGLQAGPAIVVTGGPGGLRLVSTRPVSGPSPAGARLGTVAAERLLASHGGVGDSLTQAFTFRTSLVPVALRTPSDSRPAAREGAHTFVVTSPGGRPLLEASVDGAAVAAARGSHRRLVFNLVLAVGGVTALLMIGPLLDRRAWSRARRTYLAATAGAAGLLLAARGLLFLAAPPSSAWPVLSADVYRSAGSPAWCRHPLDFLLSGLLAVALVALLAGPAERYRLARTHTRRTFSLGSGAWQFAALQLIVGAALALATVGYERFLARTFLSADTDLLYFSPHPWNAARLALAAGLVFFHAAFAWTAVLVLRLSFSPWRFARREPAVGLLLLLAWGAPAAAAWGWWSAPDLPRAGGALLTATLGLAAFLAPRGLARLRHASQGYRLSAMFLALLAPAIVLYPSMVHFDARARRHLVETRFAPEVLNQRENLLSRLLAAQDEIDARLTVLESVVSAPAPPPGASIPTEAAFLIWQDTALERYRVSSAIELYNARGALVSRFALNLPEEANRQLWHEESCAWQTFGEMSRFGAQERQLLHAGRNVCSPAGILGTIVIHVILDDSALSFLSSQNPYYELLRAEALPRRQDVPGRDLEYVVYGWSRTPIYVSGTATWGLNDAVFARVYESRRPFWTRLSTADGLEYDVFVGNDRRAIYALGYPRVQPIGHLINLAELMALAGLSYLVILFGGAFFRVAALRRPTAARHLLREIRESFYRKLFLAFVAASVIPVVTLALVTRAYIADRMRHDVEAAAHRTTAIARQVIEESTALQGGTDILNDDFMVDLSRVVGQDVNIFAGPYLVATSERDLFASGLLPARTPADVYRAIVLERMPTVITEEQAGDFRYMVAGAPLRAAWREALLTVPLTLRQQEIEREIEDLNRRIVLAAMLFILVGAAFGYPLAERISDPVSRLMRATRRISRGDFDVRIATSASDELKRLVQAFNRMSAELRQQRAELERTHRLEAWAEMARQVAHEIKNPLTPIQLSAEHLRRVHEDRGRPLDPVLEGCVDSILSQVRLLRQIASEFSSFASSPTPRRTPTPLHDLVNEVVRPYVAGAGDRVAFLVDVPEDLPVLRLDRTLVGRALTNVIENALHAMPGGGSLAVRAGLTAEGDVLLTLEDTGVGMDEEALKRLFEPYFSTKAIGTGLGLSIARRNIELNDGTIQVVSVRGHGTKVEIRFTPVPAAV